MSKPHTIDLFVTYVSTIDTTDLKAKLIALGYDETQAAEIISVIPSLDGSIIIETYDGKYIVVIVIILD